jgi:hypothetical protein
MFYHIEYIHAGKKIEELLTRIGMTKSVMAQNLGMSQGNSSYLTKRESMDVKTLHQIGVMLEYDFWQHYPFPFNKNKPDEKDKTIGELQGKIAEMEKEMALLKMQMEAVKSENGLMRDVIAVLKRK